MIAHGISIYITTVIIISFLATPSYCYYRSIILSGTNNLPCDISSSNGQLYTAASVLTQDSSTSYSSVSLAGWFFPRGYLDQYYTLFSFHDPLSFVIYSVSYSPNDFSIRQTLGTSIEQTSTVPAFTTLQWFYIRSFIQYSSSTLYGGTTIWNTNPALLSSTLTNTIEYLHSFPKASLTFNIGNSNSNINLNPSCSVSRYISAFNQKVSDSDILSYRDDIQGMGVSLLWFFDDFYTSTNPGKLMSFGESEDALIIPTLDTTPFYFSPGHTLSTDYLKANNNLGFTVIFSIKMTSTSFTSCRLLTLINDIAFIDALNGNQLSLNNKLKISSVNFNRWIQILLVVKYGITTRMMLTAYSYHSQNKYIDIPNYRTMRLKFGSATNTDTFQMSSIRVYQGVYLSQYITECPFAIMTLPVYDCLICESGYLLDNQNEFQCILSSDADSNITFQKEYSPPRITCPLGMVHDLPSSTTCRCRNQHYFNGSTCIQCARYCDGCSGSANTCTIQDSQRDSSGVCSAGTFDDGYSCKNIGQLIPNTQLRTHIFDSPTYSSSGALQPQSMSFDNDFLLLENQSSLLLTFSFQPASTVTYSNSPITTVILSGIEVFTIIITSTAIGKQISLLILGTSAWSYYIHPNNASWYALWSDLQTATLSIHTNGMLYSNSFTITTSATMTNPLICAGSCSTLNSFGSTSTLAIGVLNHRPLYFIANTLNPMLFDEQILNLMLADGEILAMFLQSYQSEYQDIYTSSSTTATHRSMKFYSTIEFESQNLRGFSFLYGNTYATIDVGLLTFPLSFSTSIYIDTINSQTSLLSYDMTSELTIEYYLVPSELLSSAIVRICFGFECQDSQVKLYYAEASFLAIFTKDLSPFSTEFLRIQFKVICKKASEILTFIIARPSELVATATTATGTILIKLGVQSEETKDYTIYLNRILLIQGNSYFYEDIDEANHCYFSFNNSPSICIRSKDGYVIYENTAITEEQCITDGLTIRFVNVNTQECVDSLQPKVECMEIDQNTLYCLQCTFGYFLLPGQRFCQQCTPPCSSCIDESTYCLTCYSSTQQIAPSCDCAETGSYLNSSYLCFECDLSCATCVSSATNCLTCSKYYEVNANNSSECVAIVCDSQCQTCTENASNCETCTANRETPPACECIANTEQTSDGSCLACASGTFFSSAESSCQPCLLPCIECTGSATHCTACDTELIFTDTNTCVCSDSSSSFIVKSNGDIICGAEMKIDTFTITSSSNIVLQFTFEHELYTEYILKYEAGQVISVYLSDTPSDYYSLSNPKISGNTFSVDLVVTKAISASSGYALFLTTAPFMSQNQEYAMSMSYLTNPFLIEQIGPLIFPKDDSLFADVDLKSSNEEVFVSLQGFQILFYILNSLQPTMIVLLLKLQFPTNLYSFLQFIGSFGFPDVKNYMDNSLSQPSQLFEYDLFQNQLTSTSDQMFKRVGLLKSILVTIPLVCFKYILIVFLLFIVTIWAQNRWKRDLSHKLEAILINQIISENEVNLLLSGICILVQMNNTESDSWTSRYGFYCSVLIVGCHVYGLRQLWKQLYHQQPYKQINSNDDEEAPNRNASVIPNPFFVFLTERIKKKRQASSRVYFLLQMIKKYVIVGVVYFFRNFEQSVCIMCALVFLLSAISTAVFKPYLTKRTRNVKIIMDINFFITWMILFKIADVELQLYTQEQLIDDDLVALYNQLGYATVIILLVSNVIYMIEQVCSMVGSLIEFIQSKLKIKQKMSESETSKVIPTLHVHIQLEERQHGHHQQQQQQQQQQEEQEHE